MVKPAKYRGTYHVTAQAMNRRAYANPDTRCAAIVNGRPCGKTLAQHPPTKSGRPPRWSAGHPNPDAPTHLMQHEVLGCNVAEGNTRRNEPHTERW